MNKAIEIMKTLGANLIDVTIPTYNQWDASELDVLLYEFKDGLNRYLEMSGAPHRSLESLIAFNKANADHRHAVFRPGVVRTRAGERTADRCCLQEGAQRLEAARGGRGTCWPL